VTGLRELVPTITSAAGTFAGSVLRERQPAIVEQVRTAHPYGPEQLRRLESLLAESLTGQIQLPSDDADGARWPDAADWATWLEPYRGGSRFEAPFLVAENWFYRRLLDAVAFVEPGPWQGVDPFAALKTRELAALPPVPQSRPDRDALLAASVWGNAADLGFQLVAADAGRHDDWLVDDSGLLWELLDRRPRRLAWVCDNAGRELVADLLLVDRLLADGLVADVTLHLKPRPYFVSDATVRDLADCVVALAATGAGEAADRLRAAAAQGRLVAEADPFWCAPLELRDAPPGLATRLAAADLVVLKGDLNYRRLVGDAAWPASTPFADAVQLPAPVAVLRTMKSDVVVGLHAMVAAQLDADAPGWRSEGSRALVQVLG
jgi:Damage-control phosphatase ARMT1-like domain